MGGGHGSNVRVDRVTLIVTTCIHAVTRFPRLGHFIIGGGICTEGRITINVIILGSVSSRGNAVSGVCFSGTGAIFRMGSVVGDCIRTGHRAPRGGNARGLVGVLLDIPKLLGIKIGFFGLLSGCNLLPGSVVGTSPFRVDVNIAGLTSVHAGRVCRRYCRFNAADMFLTVNGLHRVMGHGNNRVAFMHALPVNIAVSREVYSNDCFTSTFGYLGGCLTGPRLLRAPPRGMVPSRSGWWGGTGSTGVS